MEDNDDMLVGNEGLETIDPKDFPELYPREEDIEGLSQESHPDSDRDFENLDETKSSEPSSSSSSPSVLLSDKERSEEEFSWFVDESYPTATGFDLDAEKAATEASSSDFVPLWQKNAQRTPGSADESTGEEDISPDSISGLVKLLESERARNIKVIDMREKCDWTNWMVIAEGLSERHLGNVADQVYGAVSGLLHPSAFFWRVTSYSGLLKSPSFFFFLPPS